MGSMELYDREYHSLVTWPPYRKESWLSRGYKAFKAWYNAPLVRSRVSLLLREIELAGAERILEVGCGNGSVLESLNEALGEDIYVEGIDVAEAYAVSGRKPRIRQMDVAEMKYAEGSFDMVYCFHILEHVEDLSMALSEITRVLVPGGRLVIISPLEIIRGSQAVIEAILLKRCLFRGLKLSRELHRRVIRPLESRPTPFGTLALVKKKTLLATVFSPELFMVYRKVSR